MAIISHPQYKVAPLDAQVIPDRIRHRSEHASVPLSGLRLADWPFHPTRVAATVVNVGLHERTERKLIRRG